MMALRQLLLLCLLCICVSASLVDDIISAIEAAVDCPSCHALLVPLKTLAFLGDTVFSDSIDAICKAVKVEDADVCAGVTAQQGPILAKDLRSISALKDTATKLCNTIGFCDVTPIPYTVPFPKAAPTNPKVFTSTGKAPFQVTHFSDVHIDRQYTTGAEVNCTKPICCRHYADQSGTVSIAAGPEGSHQCDTPATLVHSMLRAAAAQNVQFSIFTGDVVEAAVWLVEKPEVISDLQLFNNELATYLTAPVFPAIGNHEASPVNDFPRNTTSTSADLSMQWVFDTQSSGWSQWINTTAASQVQHMSGSYAVVAPGTNLRIISINTVYWYKLNLWLYDSDLFQPDPNGILGFLVQQLQIAEDAGQRAWIIAHMPPSGPDVMHDQSNYFTQIVQRYHNTIAAQFYGHTHDDEFIIGYSDYSNQNANTANSFGFIAPSLTPRQANPAFKVYDVDPDTYEIMDSRVYISNMSDPSFQSSPVWQLEYSARKNYAPFISGGWPATAPLNASFWHKLTETFASNDAVFQVYNGFKTRNYGVAACDATCKSTAICNLRALRAENNCIKVTPGISFRRRDEDNQSIEVSSAAGHCEGVGLGSILSQITTTSISADTTDSLRVTLQGIIGDT